MSIFTAQFLSASAVMVTWSTFTSHTCTDISVPSGEKSC